MSPVVKLIFYYIYWAIRLKVPPWRYFQINAKYFDGNKGIYSKLAMDAVIPKKWRLSQHYLDKNHPPSKFPVFVKPEWGQNGRGIVRIDSAAQFAQLSPRKKMTTIVQQAASGNEEYEIFYIRGNGQNTYAVFTIVRTLNDEPYPINHVKNKNTTYQDITADFNRQQLAALKCHLDRLPAFLFARIGVCCNNKTELLKGLFQIIEINLFAPMPLNLLDEGISQAVKNQFIKNSMYHLALASKTVDKKQFKRFILLKTIIRHYQA